MPIGTTVPEPIRRPLIPPRTRAHAGHPSTGISRRRFLAFAAAVPFAFASLAMLDGLEKTRPAAPIRLPSDLPVGLTLTGDVIASRSPDGRLRAFAARCTHLGCRLGRIVDGQIVCPCHGSRFFADGQVAAGPAARPLTEWPVTRDPVSGGWIVHAG